MNTDVARQSYDAYRRRLFTTDHGHPWPSFKESLISLTTVLLLSLGLSVSAAPTPEGRFEIKQEMAFSVHSFYGPDWPSPLTTHNGSIYFVYVDPQLRTMIAKKSPDGKITTNVILDKTIPDEHHTFPSVGIDRDGYIHVAYNMHHSRYKQGDEGWQYKVSNKPEDISSFTFVGGNSERTIPGIYITYPFFARDNNGVLYVTFRHRTGKWAPGPNVQGIGIARYNADSKTWAMLGGKNYPQYSVYDTKTFFWTTHSREREGHVAPYQGFRARIFFDRNNRMHVSWDVFVKPGRWPSHIMYAYSDDGGNTFKRADGTTIDSLPISVENGDVVEAGSSGIYYTLTSPSVTPQGRPIVSFHRFGDQSFSYTSTWDGDNWTTKKVIPSAFPGHLATNERGVTTVVQEGKLNQTVDNGATWKSYGVTLERVGRVIFDYASVRDTDQLRFQTVENNMARVWTARFPGGIEDGKPSPPTGLKIEEARAH